MMRQCIKGAVGSISGHIHLPRSRFIYLYTYSLWLTVDLAVAWHPQFARAKWDI